MTSVASTIEQRALELLGQGVQQSQVASALGVSESYISQLLSDTLFAEKVTQLRFEKLKANNARDAKYDALEDTLLNQFEQALPFIVKPFELMRALKTVNEAKRRGQITNDQTEIAGKVVALVMPTKIIERYVITGTNQVVEVGNQPLLTIQPEKLKELVERQPQNEQIEPQRVRATVPSRSYSVADL
jgi:transcriptional regulator with XRE-family HTH domain